MLFLFIIPALYGAVLWINPASAVSESFRGTGSDRHTGGNVRSLTIETGTDLGLFFYRQELTRRKVVDFYAAKTGSAAIAELILESASKENIPLTLAFGLAWGESRYRVNAVNRNRNSIDRGVYQLNSRSFPHLTEREFFDPRINIPTGLSYLRYCLDAAGNEVAGLAMYNAGRRRVTTTGAPKMTLDYISKILEYAGTLHNEFNNEMNLTRLTTGYRDDGSSYISVSFILDSNDKVR